MGVGSHFTEVRFPPLSSRRLQYCSQHSRLLVEPFEDEIHPRLRYAHRGLVGMGNSGKKNTNESQFFITLG